MPPAAEEVYPEPSSFKTYQFPSETIVIIPDPDEVHENLWVLFTIPEDHPLPIPQPKRDADKKKPPPPQKTSHPPSPQSKKKPSRPSHHHGDDIRVMIPPYPHPQTTSPSPIASALRGLCQWIHYHCSPRPQQEDAGVSDIELSIPIVNAAQYVTNEPAHSPLAEISQGRNGPRAALADRTGQSMA